MPHLIGSGKIELRVVQGGAPQLPINSTHCVRDCAHGSLCAHQQLLTVSHPENLMPACIYIAGRIQKPFVDAQTGMMTSPHEPVSRTPTQLDMEATFSLYVALKASDAEGETVLTVPRATGSHSLGVLQDHPQLVLTFDGLPRRRVIRVRQRTTSGSYHLLVDDLSPGRNWDLPPGLWTRKVPLRSHTVPATAMATACSSDDNGIKSGDREDRDFLISWTVTEAPTLPLGSSTQAQSLVEGSQCLADIVPNDLPGTTAWESAGSDLSDTTDLSYDPHQDVPALDRNDRPDPHVSEPAELERVRFSGKLPRLRTSAKRRSDKLPPLARATKRPRPSPSPDALTNADELSQATYSEDDEMVIVSSRTTAEDPGTPPPSPPPPTFPCPFFLHNPQGHPLCLRYHLQNPHSVKRHLDLHHRRPPFCPVCGRTFATHAACDSHIVSRSCPPSETRPVVEGLTEAQIEKLSRRSDPSLSEAEQYRAVWEIVFPGIEPPPASSPHRSLEKQSPCPGSASPGGVPDEERTGGDLRNLESMFGGGDWRCCRRPSSTA